MLPSIQNQNVTIFFLSYFHDLRKLMFRIETTKFPYKSHILNFDEFQINQKTDITVK